ncbi:hypothetical protein J3R83DRAFT_13766 [Lanmaoa asiatica]|nr:hypothetical protein J3R83DRAFT_13766 [Lanmaoa asiatica]
MFPSIDELPFPTSPHASYLPPTGLFVTPDQFLTSTYEDAYRPHDSLDSDSDSSSKDSPVSVASDRHLLYSHDHRLNADPRLQYSKEKKTPRRVYFDYGITSSSRSDSPFPAPLKFEDSQDIQIVPHSYTRLIPYTFPWELPSPSHAHTTISHRADANNKDFRTDSFYHSQPFWLALYFCFNLGLTLYNKAVLIHFPYGYALTALHALCGSIGGFALLRLGILLYTVNIAVSNLSLELVTIPFHQVVRAATPIFTLLLSMFLFGTRTSRQKIASLVPVIAGVGFATYGDYYFTTSGFLLTLLGTLLAAIKTIYTSILQSSPSSQAPSTFRYLVPPRLQLHPLDLLTRMAPLAFIQCVILSYVTGELEQVRHWSTQELTPWTAVALGLNGAIAFGLNIVSFTANKKAGPLSMTVAGTLSRSLNLFGS